MSVERCPETRGHVWAGNEQDDEKGRPLCMTCGGRGPENYASFAPALDDDQPRLESSLSDLNVDEAVYAVIPKLGGTVLWWLFDMRDRKVPQLPPLIVRAGTRLAVRWRDVGPSIVCGFSCDAPAAGFLRLLALQREASS